MKRKKNEEKELPGGVKWASPTDKVYNIGLVVGGIPVFRSEVRTDHPGGKNETEKERGKGTAGRCEVGLPDGQGVQHWTRGGRHPCVLGAPQEIARRERPERQRRPEGEREIRGYERNSVPFPTGWNRMSSSRPGGQS